MNLKRLVYRVTMHRSKKYIVNKYGEVFWKDFKQKSMRILNSILPKVPDIGESIFAFNYDFCPTYISWYKSFMELGLSSDEACKEIWKMNECLVTIIPSWMLSLSVNAYLGGFRRSAARHEQRMKANKLHPYDWKIAYREIDDKTFEIDITECAMLKLSKDFDALGMYPAICRMDYLFSHYMGSGFERTKTLGDGDSCCNCRYHMRGSCEWAPEKGFEYRK